MKSWLLLVVAVTLTSWLTGCRSDEPGGASSRDTHELAASVNDWQLTREELEHIIAGLPENQRSTYDTPGGRAELANRMIEEEVFHQEAKRQGLQNQEHIKKQVANFERSLVIQEFFRKFVEPRAVPTEEELHDYYEAHRDAYTIKPIVRAQHIFSKNKDKLIEYKRMIESNEMKMTTVAHKFSEDELTRDDGGDLGYFNPGGYIRGIGYSEILTDVCFSMEVGVVSDPIKWEKGWSLVRVNERRPEQLKTFEEVREEIERIFVRKNIEKAKADVFEELAGDYKIDNYVSDEFQLTQRTAEELWNLAQNSTDSYQRIQHYQEIVERYPEDELAAQALFMIGFVYNEELGDKVEAERAFTRVIQTYPESDVRSTAEWMRENLDKPMPEFENIDELNKQLDSKSD